MILSSAIRAYVCAEAVDMRKSIDGLSQLVHASMGMNPLSGQVFVFIGRRRDRAKLQLTLQGTEVRGEWKLPYAAIEPPVPGEKPQAASASEPRTPKPTRADFQRGEKVSFTDRHLQVHVGIITRCNPKSASVDTGDGNSWSVPYGALTQVLDV